MKTGRLLGTRPWDPVLAVFLAVFAVACGGGPVSKDASKAGSGPTAKDLLTMGKTFANGGDYVRAEQYLTLALEEGANEKEVLPVLFRVCVASKHYRLAIDYAEAALRRRPKDAKLHFLCGALYTATGESPRARSHLETAAGLLPENSEVQYAAAVFFRDEMQDRAAADRYFRVYLRLSPVGEHAEEARGSLLETVP